MSGMMQAELAATCSSLGGIHDGNYVLEPQCLESVRDIIRFLRRDNEYHQVRCYLGEAKILQTDLVHIAASNTGDLFDIVIRLLVNLTNPVLLLYKEELPVEKVGRNLYMKLVGYSQEYKIAFCSVTFWTAVCKALSDLFEIDWTERSEDSSLQIERLLVLLRNVLQVPADSESERRPDNDITVHDKVLWALRESQILELLLYVSSNKDESKYYLHLVEIFSLILREQSPELLASCEIRRSTIEKDRDASELVRLRQVEKLNSRVFKNTRNFTPTFVVKNVKSISENEVIYHKSLDKLYDLKLTQDKKRVKTPKNKCPLDSERPERRSTFSVRLFLKEFCVELLSCSFNNLMGTVKEKLVSGRGLANDESYYFWALKFFLEFACHANTDIKLISECLNVQTFHFTQTQIENCYDHLVTDKKKMATWIRRLHLMIKAYHSLLKALQWMDSSQDKKIRESCKVLKSNIFYVVEYRELMVSCLLKYDPGKFPNSFLRDLIEASHLNLKLLESFCKSNKIVVQKKKRIIKRVKKVASAPTEETPATPDDIWNEIKDTAYDSIMSASNFPEIPPFDAASDTPIDEQKEEAMRNIQKYLRNKDVRGAIGLLRSARQVWPENDTFGSGSMAVEEEVMALQEICLVDLGIQYGNAPTTEAENQYDEEEEEEDVEKEEVIEQNFEIQDYIKKLVNKKVVEGCSILLNYYKQNSVHTNHCIAKLLHRIAFDCKTPALLYQASLFITLSNLLKEKDPRLKELQQFAKYIVKKFRENAKTNPKIFMELLFWKDTKIAHDIEEGYAANDESEKRTTWEDEEEDELKRLFMEFEEKMLNVDKIDWIKDNLINQSRSRLSIIRKLKDMYLIAPGAKVLKKKLNKNEWSESESAQLAELYQKFKDAVNPVEIIKERASFNRSKKNIKDKLLELGLVSNLAELRKKRVKKGKPLVSGRDGNESDSNDNEIVSSEESEVDDADRNSSINTPIVKQYARNDVLAALKNVEHMNDALKWLKETFEEYLEEDSTSEGYPLLALDSSSSDALENTDFQSLLKLFDLKEPSGEQMFWKIVPCSKLEINERIEILSASLSGDINSIRVVSDNQEKMLNSPDVSDDDEDEFEKLKRFFPSSNPENGSHADSESNEMDVSTSSLNRSNGTNGIKDRNSRAKKSVAIRRRAMESDEDSDRNSGVPEKPRINSRAIGSGDSDVSDNNEDEFDKLKRSLPSSDNRSNGTSHGLNSKAKKSGAIRNRALESDDDSDTASGIPENPRVDSRAIGSDRSDASDNNEDEFDKLKRSFPSSNNELDAFTANRSNGTSHGRNSAKKSGAIRKRVLESDEDSDTGSGIPGKPRVESRAIGSDRSDNGNPSEGEDIVSQQKTISRRPACLASDSEEEAAPLRETWNHKRRRCIGSDSEVEETPSDDEGVRRPLEVRKKSKIIDSDSDLEGHGSADDVQLSR